MKEKRRRGTGNSLQMPLRLRGKDSYEVAPSMLAHSMPTVVSVAAVGLWKSTMEHFIVSINLDFHV